MSAVRAVGATGGPRDGVRPAPTSASLHIDWTRCDGRGLCAELLASRIRRDPWGYPLAEGGNDVPVTVDELDAARDAVALCPRLALSLRPS